MICVKINPEYILREIAGECILIPTGNAARKFSGLVAMNESGKFLFNLLKEECTEECLLERFLETYEIDPETALNDIREFTAMLHEIGATDE